MRWTVNARAATLSAAVLTLVSSAGAADIVLGLESAYQRGDFGTGIDAEVRAVRLSLGVIEEDWDLTVSLPSLSFEDDAGFEVSGVGDLFVQVGWPLGQEKGAGLALHGSISAKFPTADADRGLGTGEADLGVSMAMSGTGGQWRSAGYVGAVKVGDPPGLDYDDVLVYGLGAFRQAGRTLIHTGLDGRTAMLGTVAPLEFRLGAYHALNYRLMVSAGLMVGLNEASPDRGLSLGIHYWI